MNDINTLFNQLDNLPVDFNIPIFAPLNEEYNPYDSPDYATNGFTGAFVKKRPPMQKPLTMRLSSPENGTEEDTLDEKAKSSTERVRRYYKRHPEKVRKYLRDTQDDRVQRNKDRAKAVKKHGKAKMKNHDVHHPNGPGNGWRLAKKDHGRDKKDGTPPESGPTKKPSTEKTPTKKSKPSAPKKQTKKSSPKKPSPVKRKSVSKKDTMKKSIAAFLIYAMQQLGIVNKPNFVIIEPTDDMKSLGHFNPAENKIAVVIKGRLLADILRTLAHELVHAKQMQDGRLTNPAIDGATGSDIENEANALAGVLMRNYGKINKKIFLSEGLIVEGGAHGHLAHPFEDTDLSFDDFDAMLERSLVGNLEKEGPVVEKMDGQNIAFTIRDGRVVFARNKGHLKNRAEKALSSEELSQMFAGRGEISDAFTLAAQDIEAAMAKLSPEEIENVFGNGRKVMSTEIIYPDTKNVIPYDKTVLVFHGTLEHDDDGEKVGVQDTSAGKTISDAVTRANADKQRTFGISGPRTVAISDKITEELQSTYTRLASRMEELRDTYGLKPKATLRDYLGEWWEDQLSRIEVEQGFKFTNGEREGLIKRWVDNDKKFGVKNLSDDKKEWFRAFEKEELKPLLKESTRPFEQVFLTAGVYALKRVVEFLSANNPAMAEQLKKEFAETVQAVRDTGGDSKLEKLEVELARLKELGVDSVVPTEGLIFTYNGNPYKLTGAFAPVNQIMGTLKYDRSPEPVKEQPTAPEPSKADTTPEPVTQPSTSQEPDTSPPRKIAIYPGRFQPYHAGHQVTYDALVQQFGKENVFIVSSDKQDSITSPFSFNEKREIMSQMFGIPEEQIVQVKQPYSPVEVLEKFPENTQVVFAVGEKDAERMRGSYMQPYNPDEPMAGYKTAGYVWIAPPPNIEVNGKEISGTQLRAVMGDPTITERAKKEIFTKVYGKFDQDVFNKVVKVTEKAEEARQLTAQHGQPEKATKQKKAPDEKAVGRAKSVLTQRVKNPDTGRNILVATALTYPEDHAARKEAEALVQAAMQKTETILMENKNTSDNLKVYVYVKEHTEEELEHEIDEYFKNERTLKAFPNLADSSYELIDMIKKAPAEVLDIHELKALQNSDVGDILSGKNKTQILKQMIGNKKDVTGLLTDIKAKKPISMPVVIKHVSGYYLLGGNTRLSVLASLGHTMPVKVLGRSAPFDSPISVYPEKDGKAQAKKKGSGKALFQSLLKMRITNPETGNEIKIDTAMDYNKEHPAHKAAMAVIRQRMRGLSNRAGIPKNRQD